ncbi:hypothetical protein VMT65_15965 [Nocardia sp. CDC153]|uniref:hypothetical protein n=1 Tax=Nocardia sp. CDC153 TaxID=3112167 RepID=UPI002DBDB16F|nr:hypothetical protein [Nocardia sp. CDC153]MEC3954537.1 hypothetical protein [Nocardia sp. CDC153]
MAAEYRVGDILEVSCPFTPTRVTALTDDRVFVEWPWWTADPDTTGDPWNGEVALAADPGAPGRHGELFRIRPTPADLTPESECRIGIPPTVVRVLEVQHYDPPRQTGRLPRPRREITCLPVERTPDSPETATFDPDDGIPRKLELRFRPYAFLEPGDQLADAEARTWRFESAWDWHPLDGRPGDTPTWPLMLLTRHGSGDDDAAAVDVVEATSIGSHEDELAQWATLAGVEDTAPPEDSAPPAHPAANLAAPEDLDELDDVDTTPEPTEPEDIYVPDDLTAPQDLDPSDYMD